MLGLVEAYHKNTNVTPNTYSLVASEPVLSGNSYALSGLAESAYLVRFVPLATPNTLVATYYPANIDWQNATLITTNANTASLSHDITPFLAINLNGNITVNGAVGYGPNGFTRSGITLAEGVEVFLKNSSDDLYAQSTTDANGLYTFNNVPNGIYTIVINIPGYTQISSYNFTVNDNSPDFMGLDFVIDNGEIFRTGSTLQIPKNEIKSLTVFPNPTNGQLTIEIPEDFTNFQMNAFDQMGKKVWTNSIQNNTNKYYTTDISELANGIYFISLMNADAQYNIKIVKE